jgi:hypothetical protein
VYHRRAKQAEIDADNVGWVPGWLWFDDVPLALDAEGDEPAVRPSPDRRRKDPPLETALRARQTNRLAPTLFANSAR